MGIEKRLKGVVMAFIDSLAGLGRARALRSQDIPVGGQYIEAGTKESFLPRKFLCAWVNHELYDGHTDL